jgi:hypothetical protein
MKDKDYENILNHNYGDMYTDEETEQQLIYLTNPSRGHHISINALRKAIKEGRAGTILKKYDPIAFHVGKNDQ